MRFGAPWPGPAGARWVTLPTGTDPLPSNSSQDDFGEAITVCRWQSADVAWVLGEGKLMRYARTAGSDAAGGPGTWTRETIIKKNIKNKKDATSGRWPHSRVSSVDRHRSQSRSAGGRKPTAPTARQQRRDVSGTIGHPTNDNVDTLWWFDGTSKWFKTRLRKDEQGHPRGTCAGHIDCVRPSLPQRSVCRHNRGRVEGRAHTGGQCRPDVDVGAAPEWLTRGDGGDLGAFSDGSLRLLRAAIAARGVWELRLDVADVTDLTYVRAHDDDLRYRARAIDKQRDLTTARSWHGSPDAARAWTNGSACARVVDACSAVAIEHVQHVATHATTHGTTDQRAAPIPGCVARFKKRSARARHRQVGCVFQ